MSDLSQIKDTVQDLIEGKISPEQFLSTVASDLQKDVQIFTAIPGVVAFYTWAIEYVINKVTATTLSDTLKGILTTALKDLIPKA